MMIVFSDLDGTLLDHETYSFEPARPALAALKAQGVPLVLATSKTAAEIGPIRAALGLDTPAIVENGGGMDWPEASDEPSAGDDYAAIRAGLAILPPPLRACFRGFGDMQAAEIARLTGLDAEAARRAALRRFSEPGLFAGTDEQRAAFLDHLARAGFHAVRGGRFLTISRGATKAGRMAQIRDALAARLGRRLSPVVALGDAENDRAMLEAAEIGVIVANPAHAPLAPLAGESEGGIIRTALPGPRGWNAAILDLLRQGAGAEIQGERQP